MLARLGQRALRRLAMSLLTLVLLSMVVFAGAQVLPGDVGRAILGPLASPDAVAVINHQIGADKPAVEQYLTWIGHLLTGDMGQSYAYRSPVAPFIGAALVNSLKLAGMVFLLVVRLAFGLSLPNLVNGIALGSLYGVVGVGHRAQQPVATPRRWSRCCSKAPVSQSWSLIGPVPSSVVAPA